MSHRFTAIFEKEDEGGYSQSAVTLSCRRAFISYDLVHIAPLIRYIPETAKK